ncbi:MAG TPA: type II toxin-antitoxin system RelE/ParE family toxin [Lichenihabitans sp.]|jgi:plasmid stabilization system protein ParE|nr:type II toxin-antitoxin system RelE/ParE family toxin [Lichenihabitans sp.]
MIVVFTDAADTDLERIGDHIADQNPRRAASFVAELVDRCEQLTESPQAFPVLPRYKEIGIRRRSYGNYLILYRIEGEHIEILHILHGARDYETILFPAEPGTPDDGSS